MILIKVTFLAEVNYSTYSFSLYMPSNAINNEILKYILNYVGEMSNKNLILLHVFYEFYTCDQ